MPRDMENLHTCWESIVTHIRLKHKASISISTVNSTEESIPSPLVTHFRLKQKSAWLLHERIKGTKSFKSAYSCHLQVELNSAVTTPPPATPHASQRDWFNSHFFLISLLKKHSRTPPTWGSVVTRRQDLNGTAGGRASKPQLIQPGVLQTPL